MSNRHWEFLVENLLAPLNDKLAVRHGANYEFTVPEGSFDWDVEFSAIKDRGGNKVREEYISAWVKPSLVGPQSDIVHLLNTKLYWKTGMNEFLKEDQTKLFSEVDSLLGSPLKTKEVSDKEAPPEEETESVQNIKSSVFLKIARSLIAENELIQRALKYLQSVANSKLLDSSFLREVERQDEFDKEQEMYFEKKTTLFYFVVELIAKLIKEDSYTKSKAMAILNEYSIALSRATKKMSNHADEKLKGLLYLKETLMALYEANGVDFKSFERDFETVKQVDYDSLFNLLNDTIQLNKELQEGLNNLNISSVVSPQKAEQFVEEIIQE